MIGDTHDFSKETLGFEADRLLRTVTRLFYSNYYLPNGDFLGDTCPIILDAILRNHYQTSADDLRKVFPRAPKTKIDLALNVLVENGILVTEKRNHLSLLVNKPDPKPKSTQSRGFSVYDYTYQKKQQTQEQVQEQSLQKKMKQFYYVDYHRAVELIRYRLYKLLGAEKIAETIFKCSFCKRQYSESDYMALMDKDYHHPCKNCRHNVLRIAPDGSHIEEENSRRAVFKKILQPVSSLLNIVMKKSFIPFDTYSPEETRLIEMENEKKGKKSSNSGYTDDLVEIEEVLEPCPGALAKSVRVRNRAIPWLVHHGFFSTVSSEEGEFAVDEDLDSLSPSSKRLCVKEEGKYSLDQLTEEDKQVIRKAQSFDRFLQQTLPSEPPEDMFDVPDSVSIRSGSTFSADDHDSDMEVSSGSTSPQQEQKLTQEQIRVCRGFDEHVLEHCVVCVAGELRPLDGVTVVDVNRMNDEEYKDFANKIALIAGIS